MGSQQQAAPAENTEPLAPQTPPGRSALTFAGFPVAAQAEPGAAPAGPALVAVPQQANVRAASRLPKLIGLAGVAPHCNTVGVAAVGDTEGTRRDTRLQLWGCGDALMGPPWALGELIPPRSSQPVREGLSTEQDTTEMGKDFPTGRIPKEKPACPSTPPQPHGHTAPSCCTGGTSLGSGDSQHHPGSPLITFLPRSEIS